MRGFAESRAWAPRSRRAFTSWVLSIAGLVLAVGGGVFGGTAGAAVVTPVAPHSLIVFPARDFLSYTGDPNTAYTVNVLRNGVLIGTASGTSAADGIFEVNHPGGVCWDTSTPDIIPGDVVQVLTAPGVGELTTTANVFSTPAEDVGGVLTVHGTAQDATGAPLPPDQIQQRMIAVGLPRFSNGKRDLRAGALGNDGVLSYDAPGSIHWTATYTGLSAADMEIAVASQTRIMWLGVDPGALTELTIFEAATVGGPSPGCPAAANFGATSANKPFVNAANVATDLVVSGVSTDASAVSVTLDDTDPATSPLTASAVLSAPSGAQAWTATFPGAQVATLADGTLTAASTFTIPTGVIPGTVLTLTKDTVSPAAPTSVPPPGVFETTQQVSLHSVEPAVHFTMDGSPATATSPTFNALVEVSLTTGPRILRAVVVDAAGNISPEASFSFAVGSPAAVGAPAAAPAPVGVTAARNGYWLLASDGGVFAFGDAPFFGSLGGVRLSSPVVAMVATPSGNGYWMVTADGQVFSFGDAAFFGSMAGRRMAAPIVGMTSTPSGRGYWLLGKDGGIFSFGDAAFHGSTGAIRLNKPVLAMASTPSGQGYWLTASDGGIFAFGDAGFHGSTGAIRLNRPIVGMRPSPSGQGYWLTASDGGIFAFGDAAFHGSTGAMTLNRPIVGMAATPSGNGYLLIASDGGIFAFGDAAFRGSTGNITLNSPIISGAATR